MTTLHVYTNKINYVIGTSLEEALETFDRECGLIAPGEPWAPNELELASYTECAPTDSLRIYLPSRTPETRTIAEWIVWWERRAAEGRRPLHCIATSEAC